MVSFGTHDIATTTCSWWLHLYPTGTRIFLQFSDPCQKFKVCFWVTSFDWFLNIQSNCFQTRSCGREMWIAARDCVVQENVGDCYLPHPKHGGQSVESTEWAFFENTICWTASGYKSPSSLFGRSANVITLVLYCGHSEMSYNRGREESNGQRIVWETQTFVLQWKCWLGCAWLYIMGLDSMTSRMLFTQ